MDIDKPHFITMTGAVFADSAGKYSVVSNDEIRALDGDVRLQREAAAH